MSKKYFRSLIALIAMGLLIASGSAFAASHEEGEEFSSDFIEGEEEGERLEVLEGFVSPGVITDSMLLNAGKDPNNWILYGKDYAHTRYSQLDEINTETTNTCLLYTSPSPRDS